ncbi:MAG: 3-mercaptopyruvate sulfurtransferase [Alphaproteobacteria bacterium]|nr:3-mercaptopyruvate sulfurtransferase [Alphaproteobacteria bacterium SS10]
MSDTPLLVETDWLAAHLGDPDVRVIDASFHLPNAGRSVTAEFVAGHIPGAVLFDIEAVRDVTSDLPHMLPSAEDFGGMVGALGLGNQRHIIAYDTVGIFSAPRAWWMFRAMGHENVSVLNGGLPAWTAAGHDLATGNAAITKTSFSAKLQRDMVAGFTDMQTKLADGEQVLDARGAARFTGEVEEPRAGLRSGHMPGAKNLPFDQLLADGRFKDGAALKAAFDQLGIKLDQPIATTCGSGVTAAVLTFALALLGKHDVQLYDGSWSEWGQTGAHEVVTGP